MVSGCNAQWSQMFVDENDGTTAIHRARLEPLPRHLRHQSLFRARRVRLPEPSALHLTRRADLLELELPCCFPL